MSDPSGSTATQRREKTEAQEPESLPSPPSAGAPPPPPPQVPTEVLAVSPTKEDLIYVLFLLSNLALTSYSLQTNVKPIFGKTYGQLSFHAGALIAVLIFSFALPDKTKVHRRSLEVASGMQVLAGIGARSFGAIAATFFEEEPTVAAWIVHSVLSFPAIGLGGAVWLHWTRKFMDQEPTRGGQLAINVFTCVALVSVVKYLEPLIGDSILRVIDLPPKATLVFLGMTTFTLSIIFKPSRPSSSTPRPTPDNAAEVYTLSKFITVMSAFTIALTIPVPPSTPTALSVQYQRFTPHGFVQIIDNNSVKPASRYVRLDSSILGEVELRSDGNVGGTKAVSDALLDGVRLVQGSGSKDKKALVIGIQSGYSTRSLTTASYNTTVVDARGPLIAAVQTHLGFSAPDHLQVVTQDPAIWMFHHVRQQADTRKEKFDVVIHDVFEGGELPARMYTVEFWEAVRNVLDEHGVLAVRYVGKPSDVTFKSVLNMLRKNFKTCRAFHSNLLDQHPTLAPHEITEVVIFCTPAQTLSFTPVKSSFSSLTSSVFTALDKREVDISSVLADISPSKYLLREEDPAVVKMWGKDGVVDYWKLTRQRYPAPLWHSY